MPGGKSKAVDLMVNLRSVRVRPGPVSLQRFNPGSAGDRAESNDKVTPEGACGR